MLKTLCSQLGRITSTQQAGRVVLMPGSEVVYLHCHPEKAARGLGAPSDRGKCPSMSLSNNILFRARHVEAGEERTLSISFVKAHAWEGEPRKG